MKLKNTKLYLVGGSCRDMILKKEPKDKDYVAITSLSFEELCNEVKKVGIIFQAKKEFLTIRCKLNGEVIDIALPRKEDGYDDNRHPKNVERVDTLKEDASRRDFTMNTLYWNEEEGFIDNFKGKESIANKLIKCVGEPNKRFEEDYLRMLRAVRFSCQLGFAIDGWTYASMKMLAFHLVEVQTDRIRQELNKSLSADAKKTMWYLNDLKLFRIIKKKGLTFECTSKVIKNGN